MLRAQQSLPEDNCATRLNARLRFAYLQLSVEQEYPDSYSLISLRLGLKLAHKAPELFIESTLTSIYIAAGYNLQGALTGLFDRYPDPLVREEERRNQRKK